MTVFRFSVNLEFGRVKDAVEEPLPGEGGPGGAQVELADETPGLRVGFHRPDEDY